MHVTVHQTLPKNIDKHGKQSYLEEDPVSIIGTRPAIGSHVSFIGQNIVILKKIGLVRKYQIIIVNIVDNTIPRIINHNLPYTTTINSIVMIE